MKSINFRKGSLRISQFHLLVCMLGIMSCSLWGQDFPKKLLQESDFNRWSNVWSPKISDDGKWVTYPIDYTVLKDTLVVVNPKTKINYKIAGGADGAFIHGSNTRWFVFTQKNRGVGIMDLNNGNILWAGKANYYKISPYGKMIVCIKNTKDKKKTLTLVYPQQNKVKTLTGITDFSLGPKDTQLAYAINTSLSSKIVISNGGNIEYTHNAKLGNHFYYNLIWNPQGTAVAFMDKSINSITKVQTENIISCELNTESINILNPLRNEKLAGLKLLSNLFYYSKDGQSLIFNTSPISGISSDQGPNVQEWKGTDSWLYPRVQNTWEWENQWWKTMWWPKQNKILQIANETTPQAEITSNQKYAIVYNQTQYEPEYSDQTIADLYAVDLETGERNLIEKKQDCSLDFIQLSPSGNYLSYLRDKNWWVYDFENRTCINITEAINANFYSENYDHSTNQGPYGKLGWTDGDKKVLIYDEFDIWAISSDGSVAERLTKGREENISYRIDTYNTNSAHAHKSLLENLSYNIEKEPLLVLASKHDIPYAYYKTDLNNNRQMLSVQSGKIGDLAKASSVNAVVYKTQSADHPPALFYWNNSLSTPIIIYQSNPQHWEYLVGRTERITFHNSAEQELSAVLHYPDDYKEGLEYPMIVHIYEKLSQNFADYRNPTYYEDIGFNWRVYTASGYFVLEPDILYTQGAPGMSAVNCVTDAVEEVLDRHLVDRNKIGLNGHSFGGYEAAFIITQTDLFSAAVIGSPVTDLTSYYFSVNKENYKPDNWRFENQQWRMGFSYFENKEAYLANSPLHQANKVNCPVLLWTGKNDVVIPYTQSVEFYLALRRLKKKVSFLLYPDEIHSLMKKENRYDLSVRIKSWFDQSLK
ncbi:prolyl oligopeptidase family serine peptidase [Aequorivita sp. F47161]|uniref:Prolyl oligopeptidase family serine peptidase n=1 Tax=Aequorivita vitellina TaxID=2874475 RepID=A0A9X1QWW4_9FLAO|nr:prolyl oligopeptidase family serine peptidase [Aequorivita vitellina]MCG2419386.1 prolyl oligopeptidase family serine peptidase [Aequorivita vitellina]